MAMIPVVVFAATTRMITTTSFTAMMVVVVAITTMMTMMMTTTPTLARPREGDQGPGLRGSPAGGPLAGLRGAVLVAMGTLANAVCAAAARPPQRGLCARSVGRGHTATWGSAWGPGHWDQGVALAPASLQGWDQGRRSCASRSLPRFTSPVPTAYPPIPGRQEVMTWSSTLGPSRRVSAEALASSTRMSPRRQVGSGSPYLPLGQDFRQLSQGRR